MAGIVFVELLLDGINSILTKCTEPTVLGSAGRFGSSVGTVHLVTRDFNPVIIMITKILSAFGTTHIP